MIESDQCRILVCFCARIKRGRPLLQVGIPGTVSATDLNRFERKEGPVEGENLFSIIRNNATLWTFDTYGYCADIQTDICTTEKNTTNHQCMQYTTSIYREVRYIHDSFLSVNKMHTN